MHREDQSPAILQWVVRYVAIVMERCWPATLVTVIGAGLVLTAQQLHHEERPLIAGHPKSEMLTMFS